MIARVHPFGVRMHLWSVRWLWCQLHVVSAPVPQYSDHLEDWQRWRRCEWRGRVGGRWVKKLKGKKSVRSGTASERATPAAPDNAPDLLGAPLGMDCASKQRPPSGYRSPPGRVHVSQYRPGESTCATWSESASATWSESATWTTVPLATPGRHRAPGRPGAPRRGTGGSSRSSPSTEHRDHTWTPGRPGRVPMLTIGRPIRTMMTRAMLAKLAITSRLAAY
jgi:hypothetical protein